MLHQVIFGFIVVAANIHSITCKENTSPFHLKPLGSHIKATDVDEVYPTNMLTPKAFMEKYVLQRQPVVLRSVVKQWPAFQKWTDEYLKENYPNLELRMEGRKEKRSPTPQGDISLGRDSMKHFIETYHNENTNKYVVSELPKPLYKYVNIPSPLGCGDLKKRFTEINLWINSGGAQSILHKDSPNTINCVVNGSKEWKLVEFKYNDLIYQAWEGSAEAGYGGYSLINPQRVDLKKFPKVLEIPRWYYTHIQAGDCLYLPSQMWHVVHSHGDQNVAVAFLLSQFRDTALEDLDLAGCKDEVVDNISLDKIDVDWQYPGFGNMTMGYADIVDYMGQINEFFSPKSKKLSKRRMYQMLRDRQEGYAHQDRKAKERARMLYKLMNEMAPGGDETLTKSMLANLTRNQLRDIIRIIEPHYPAGTTEYEYSTFSPEQLVKLCHSLVEDSDGILTREKFVKAYIDMNGSLKLAEEFWINLVGGDKEEVLLSTVEENFSKATEKFDYYREEVEDDGADSGEEEERNRIPESEFLSTPRGMAADFRDEKPGAEPVEESNDGLDDESVTENSRDEL